LDLSVTVPAARKTVNGRLNSDIAKLYRAFLDGLPEFELEWNTITKSVENNPRKANYGEEGYAAIFNVWSALGLQLSELLAKADKVSELCSSIETKRQDALRKVNHQRLALEELARKSKQLMADMGFRRIDENFQEEALGQLRSIEAFINLARYAEALEALERLDTKRKALCEIVDGLPARRSHLLTLTEAMRRQWCPVKIELASAKAELRTINSRSCQQRVLPLSTRLAEACALSETWKNAANEAIRALSLDDEGQRWDDAEGWHATAEALRVQIFDICAEVKSQATTIREEVEARTKLVAGNAQVNLDTVRFAIEAAIDKCASLKGLRQDERIARLSAVQQTKLPALSNLITRGRYEDFETKLDAIADELRLIMQTAYIRHNLAVMNLATPHVFYKIPTLTYHRATSRVLGVLVGEYLEIIRGDEPMTPARAADLGHGAIFGVRVTTGTKEQ
jgi:hypothetical protein